jgi:hypothetical protein
MWRGGSETENAEETCLLWFSINLDGRFLTLERIVLFWMPEPGYGRRRSYYAN